MPPTMTMVLAMGPKLLVKSAVERNLTTKAREDYTSGEVAQLCAAAVTVIMRSGVEYDEVSGYVWWYWRHYFSRRRRRALAWCGTQHSRRAFSVCSINYQGHHFAFTVTRYELVAANISF